MDIRVIAISIALAVILLIVLLATRFLPRRARIILYAVLALIALSVWAFVTINLNVIRSGLAIEPYASGFLEPTFAAFSPDGTGRLFVVERAGNIRILEDGAVRQESFLDISDRVEAGGSEQGLFSLAFHPEFSQNGLFYVYYSNRDRETVLERYHVSSDDPNLADRESGVAVVTIEQPNTNHNGGHVLFGPDSYLYLGLGDGGSGNSMQAQETSNLLGSIIRIDVSDPENSQQYSIPSDNPFVGDPVARPEILLYGLRNPWRFDLDPVSGDLYIADVGDTQREEVNYKAAGDPAGLNYGWPWYEGSLEEDNGSGATLPDDLVFPISEYDHLGLGGCSIIGGYVYRGQALPELAGKYLYGDYCNGYIWSLEMKENGRVDVDRILQVEGAFISSFARDNDGEIYLIDVSRGTIQKLVPG
jgi:glucose/arabinose dehydrogenase